MLTSHLSEELPNSVLIKCQMASFGTQASRVQFVFDDEALEVLIKSNKSENKFVGGQNRWAYDSFTNWEFWWNKFPVLVYFKVTERLSAHDS